MDIVILITLILATWRVSNLLAREEGPLSILATLRYALGVRYAPEPPYEIYGKTVFSKAIICVYCNSVWVGIVFSVLYVIWHPLWFIALPFALSAGAIMVDEILAIKDKNGKS